MSASTQIARGGLPAAPRDVAPALLAGLGTLVAAASLLHDGAWSSLGLLAISLVLGWIFLAVGFGYTTGYRVWLATGNGGLLVAGLVVAAVASLVIVPVSALVEGYGAWVWPVGVPVIGGAFLFGFGMQIANGCGSGCLYKAGGGSPGLLIALPFFCLGGLLGSLALPALLSLPAIPAVGLGDLLGPWGGLAATLAVIFALMAVLMRRGGRPPRRMLRAAVAIGVLAGGAFLLSGQPWGVTMGMTIWAAKLATLLGADLAHFTFWTWGGPAHALHAGLLEDDSSLMDIGMLLGALACSAWQGGWRQPRWPGMRVAAGAALGGVLMGIGARLSYGCNIGALVGGLSSGSLHGLAWFAAAIPGSWLGLRLRPAFGIA